MNRELSQRLGRGLRECFAKTVIEPVPTSWLELIARLEQREQLKPPSSCDCAGQKRSGQPD
jgi:anti-sigma factor NepR-like protein